MFSLTAERFLANVEMTEGCWEWRGSRFPTGYGRIYDPRTQDPNYAHRISWELHHGPIPYGLFVCHRCDNPPCVRPDHLFLGTPLDNIRDRDAKGRGSRGRRLNLGAFRRGSAHPLWGIGVTPKLDPEKVRVIRSAAAEGEKRADIAQRLGVSIPTVGRVINGQTWREVA